LLDKQKQCQYSANVFLRQPNGVSNMVEFNIVNFITISLIVILFVFLLRYAMKIAGKQSPV
jgi:hypothetical protein